jgi:hypothetical protein
LAANVTASPTTSISSLPPHTATTASGSAAAGGGAVMSTGLHRRGTEGSVLRDDDEEDEGSQMGGSQVGGRAGSVNKDGKDTKDGKEGGSKRVKRNRVHFSCVEVSGCCDVTCVHTPPRHANGALVASWLIPPHVVSSVSHLLNHIPIQQDPLTRKIPFFSPSQP